MDPVAPPATATFPPELVRRGAELAAIGNCNTCHTVPGGRVYAGGLGMETPFGVVYATNITPDPETGIGRWSETAFRRAMRRGVDREGHHLYPAFPYNHFTQVTDEDDRALYAFLMTREPVSAVAPDNDLVFPLNFRPLLAGWKLLFLEEGPRAGTDHGAYLVEGLSHCGACHTPRNVLGAERRGEALAGAVADGWSAYAINEASPAPRPWTEDALFFYLRNGWEHDHGVSRGPMAQVTSNLAAVPEGDVRAIAAEIARRMGGHAPRPEAVAGAGPTRPGARPGTADSQAPTPATGAEADGRAIYAAACASCHEAGRPLPYGGMDLHGSTAPHAPDPRNIVHVVLEGLPAAEGERAPIMPGFRGVLTDAQVVSLLRYMRAEFGRQPPWPDPAKLVAEVRGAGASPTARPTDAVQSGPADPTQRGTSW